MSAVREHAATLCQLREVAEEHLEIVHMVAGKTSPTFRAGPSVVETLGDAAAGFPRTPSLS
eukprot:2534726-Pyramimonas_sp.AAC.1